MANRMGVLGVVKQWTYTEIKYLKENWGNVSIKKMAKELKRTINALKLKSKRLGLIGDRVKLQEDITFVKFTDIIGYNYASNYFKNRLLKADFPFSYFKVVNEKICMVNLISFIKWYKKHLNMIDISNTEDGDFDALEPDWLKEKRKADKMAAEYKARFWTDEEDNRLISLLKEYKYGYREISVKLKRTEGAIKRRMTDLKLKERPLKADNHIKWLPSEIKKVKELYLKGYKSCVIAEFIPKSALAINGLLERYNYFS